MMEQRLNFLLTQDDKEQVIVLIDEYDAPLTYAYGHGYYKEAVEFFKALYSNVLKTNSNLKMGVLTGAIRVAKVGIFWSILNYIDSKELKPYWINTSGNVLIKDLPLCFERIIFEDIDNLPKGQEKTIYILIGMYL